MPKITTNRGRSHPQVGKLYAFKVTHGLTVHLVPVELAQAGFFKGLYLCYVLSPTRSPEALYVSASKDDLLIRPIITAKEFFQKGPFDYVHSDAKVKIPFWEQHAFLNSLTNELTDLNGIALTGHQDCICEQSLTGPLGICKQIAKALDLDIDCWALHGEKASDAEKRRLLLLDDYVNNNSMFVTIRIPHENGAVRDAGVDMSDIEGALVAALIAAQAGSTEGSGHGAEFSEFFLKVRQRKYPAAIGAIREALAHVGVLKYELLRGTK